MAGYLLLRDNKESGPYTAEELLNFGLKPYDLIWVEGKSAAWRYPSEIEELKPYAPAVEEQPFDRFYKKDYPATSQTFPNAEYRETSQPSGEDEYERYKPRTQEETNKPLSRPKSVFVTLPDQKRVEHRPDPVPAPQKQIPRQTVNPVPEPTISIHEQPIEAEIKYSQPLDEIKEMYVKTLQERRDKRAKKGLLLSYLKKAAVVAALVAVGILMGSIVRSKSGSEERQTDASADLMKVSTSLSNPAITQQLTDSNAVAEHESNANAEPVQNTRLSSLNERYNSSGNDTETEEPAPLKIRKETMIIVPKTKESYSNASALRSMNDPVTGERMSRLRSNEIKDELPPSESESLKGLVSVVSNDYKRVAFGGIRNLLLTVTNHSPKELDEVIVELQYLKPSEEPLRTENIRFKEIGPGSSATIRVPDTNRGIKVNYRIINIRSAQGN